MIVKEHSKLFKMLNYSRIVHFLFLISRFSRLVWNQQMCISYSRRRKDWWWCYKERFFFEVQHQTGLLSLLLCCHLFHLPKGLEELVFMAIHHPSQYPTWYSILSPWPKGFGTRSFSTKPCLACWERPFQSLIALRSSHVKEAITEVYDHLWKMLE